MNAELVQKAKSGDAAALEALLTAAQVKARPLVYRLLLPKYGGDVDDVVQEATMSALAHLQDFKGDSQFSTWFHSIVVNHALMFLRKQKVRYVMVSAEVLDTFCAPPTSRPDAIFARMTIRQEIEDALEMISVCRRRMFNGAAKQGYTMQELSEIYGVPVTTAKSNVFRARHDLQALLTQ